MSDEEKDEQEPQDEAQSAGEEQEAGAEVDEKEGGSKTSVEGAKEAVGGTARKVVAVGEDMLEAAERMGVRKSPANTCKIIFTLGLLLYLVSSFFVRNAAVSARKASEDAGLHAWSLDEDARAPVGLVAPPNPESNKYNWAFLEEGEDGADKVNIPDKEKDWYKSEVEKSQERNTKWRLKVQQKHFRDLYDDAKRDYRSQNNEKEEVRAERRQASRLRYESSPTQVGNFVRYISLLAMALGAAGLLFIGTTMEKAAALIVLGLGILRAAMI